MGENCITCDVVLGEFWGWVYVFMCILFSVGPPGGVIVLFLVFTGIVFSVGPPGAWSFCFTFLRAALGGRRPPVAPSFAARRKIEEKGVSRGCGPLNPRGNVLVDSDVLCAYVFAMVRVTRLRRLRRCRLSPCLCMLRCG